MNKKIIIRSLWIIIVFVALLSGGGYYYYVANMPNMALYCLLAGAMFILNFLLAIFLVNKNFKDKK